MADEATYARLREGAGARTRARRHDPTRLLSPQLQVPASQRRLLTFQMSAGNHAVSALVASGKAPGVEVATPPLLTDRRPPSTLGSLPVTIQRGKGKAAQKAVGWIVKVGERKLVKRAAIYTEKEMATLLAKGNNILVRRGRSVAKRVGKKVWGDDMIHHTGHILKKTGKLGRPHFQPAKSLLGKPGEKGWHIFYGIAPVLFFADDAEAMAVYEDTYPGQSMAHYLTVSKYVSEDSWLRHLDWVNPGELLAIGGDIGRTIDREQTKELIAIVFTRRTADGSTQTYELDPEGQLVRVIVVRPDGSRTDLDAETYFTLLARAAESTVPVPEKDGTGHSNYAADVDADYRIYSSRRGWSWDRRTLSFFLPSDDASKLRRVGRFYVMYEPRISYLYVLVPPRDRAVLGQPGFQVPEGGVDAYLKADDKAEHLESLLQWAAAFALVTSFFRG